MLIETVQLECLANLRNYVYQNLCDLNELEPGIFLMTERILTRGDHPCGVFFSVNGPRCVRLTAIWETDKNTILFYNSGGERVHKVELVRAPVLSPAVAQ